MRIVFAALLCALGMVPAGATSVTVTPGRPAVHSYVKNVLWEEFGGPAAFIPVCSSDDVIGSGLGATCFSIRPGETHVTLTIVDASTKRVAWGYGWNTEAIAYPICSATSGKLEIPGPHVNKPRPTGVYAFIFPSDWLSACPGAVLGTAGTVTADFGYGPVVVRP